MQVLGGDVALEVAPALANARLQRLDAGLEVDQQIGRWQEGANALVEIMVRAVIALGHLAALVQIVGEDFGVLVDAAILHDGAGVVYQAAMVLEPP